MVYFIIPILFHRNDSGYQYDGKITLSIPKDIDIPQQGSVVNFLKGEVKFNLKTKEVILRGNKYEIFCNQIELPYEDWQKLKGLYHLEEIDCITDFERV